MTEIKDKKLMPELPIDSYKEDSGNEVIGIKKMYDIALAIGDSLMQWGGPGVGKSQAVQQWNQQKVREYEERIAKGENIKPWNPVVCDVRLSMKEPVDLIGIPVPTVVNGQTKTVWAVPNMWPKDNGEFSGGVIHLDEFNQGQSAILNASFQLIQDRALGDYKVPNGYIVIASANPSEYNPTVTDLSVPLSNRFTHFNIKFTLDGWLNHRMNNGGNIDVMTFIKTQRSDLLFDIKTMESTIGTSLKNTLFTDVIATPRSWEVVEKVLNLPSKEQGGFTIEEKQLYATGRLGMEVASIFFRYLKDKEKYQSWREILKDGKPFRDENNSEQFFVTQMTCLSIISSTLDDKVCREYILNFLDATRALKHTQYKVINVVALSRLERLKGKWEIYNAMKDASDIVQLASASMFNS